MNERKLRWHKIADKISAINWQENNMAVEQAAGKLITLVKLKSDVFACAHKCPHAGGVLADGFIDAKGHLVCPLHSYRFNISNGRNVSGEGYYLKTFAVEEREAGIFVGFEEGSLFDIFS